MTESSRVLCTRSAIGRTCSSRARATFSLSSNPNAFVPSYFQSLPSPLTHPTQALAFVREFVFGSNTTGLVTNSSGKVSVAGGEVASLAAPVLPGQSEIFVGSGTTQSSVVFPSATIAAWESFFATVTSSSFSPLPTGGDATQTGGTGTSGAVRVGMSMWGVLVGAGIGLAML